jgi:hypothetical protein
MELSLLPIFPCAIVGVTMRTQAQGGNIEHAAKIIRAGSRLS